MGRVNGGLNLTRSFADFDYKKNKGLPYDEQMITCNPDIESFEVSTGDEFILVGCDGIWEKYVENSQGLIDVVKEELKKGKEHKKVTEDMLDFLLATDTNSGIGCDNMTVILIIIHHWNRSNHKTTNLWINNQIYERKIAKDDWLGL